jgi:hypothetical protein
MQFELGVDIDLSAIGTLENISKLLPKRIAGAIQSVGDRLVSEWGREAQIALKNSSGYVLKIQEGIKYPFENNPFHFVIVNRHPAVLFLENGTAAFDMKRMLSTSSKVHTGKDGHRYLRIPFEHSTKALEAAGIDPREFRGLQASMKLARMDKNAKQEYKWGDRLTDMGNVGRKKKYFTVLDAPGSKFPNKTNSAAFGFSADTEHKTATEIKYQWKSSPFENVSRFQELHGSSYMSFRTISENSDPNSWIHPGIRASHIAESAINTIDPIFKAAMHEIIPKIASEAFSRLKLSS